MFLTGQLASAASNNPPTRFESAIQRALERSPDLAIERNKVMFEKARVDEARGAFLPSLHVFGNNQQTTNYNGFSGVSINAQYGGATIPVTVLKDVPRYQANYGVELDYNLYSGGANQARVAEMSAAEQAAMAASEVAKKRVILEVAQNYWGLTKAQIALKVAMRNLDYAQEQLTVAGTQFAQGQIPKIDLDAKTIQLEKATIELHSAERTMRDFRRRYAAASGMDADRDDALPPLEETAVDVDQLLAHFGLIRQPEIQPEIQKAQADFVAAQQHREQIKAEYLPVLDLYLKNTYYGRSGSDIGMAQSNLQRDATALGVNLKWNLFDGYRSDSRVAQAAAMSEQLRLQADKVKRDLYNSREDALAGEQEASDQLALAATQLGLARSQLTIAQTRLANRQLSSLELHAAQLAAENAQSRLDTLKIDLLIRQIASRL